MVEKKDCPPWDINQRFHCKVRAMQRYNYELSNSDYELFVEMIRENHPNATFVKALSNTKKCWKIVHDENEFIVLYDKKSNGIATFLTEDQIDEEEKDDEE